MKKFLLNLGRFLRLVDDQYVCLSLTNLAVFVVLIKTALNPQPSIVDMGSLLITLSLYYGKAHLKKQKEKLTDENKTALDELKAKVQVISDKTAGLAVHVGMRNPILK
jgi:hypothetical protein